MTVFETRKPNVFDYLQIFFNADIFFISVIILAVAVFLWIKLVIPSWKEKDVGIFARLLFVGLALLFSYVFLVIANTNIRAAITLGRNYATYVAGECQVVEGYVENFHPMPEDLHDTEHFTVSGKYFFYSSENSPFYYSHCKKDGGAITGDGLKVKIWYLDEDTILRLDILEE